MPKVSVVILNWNGKHFLKECLKSFEKVKYSPLEIIVVDNNSSDGSKEYVRKHFPKVGLITSNKNNGFAKGNNLGAQTASGKYILFLNNDTKVTPQFLEPLVEACEKDESIGCVQPEIRVMAEPKLLDEAGAYLTTSGFLYHYGYRKSHSLPMYRNSRKIFSAKGACMLIPRQVLEKVKMFDEDFFIFFEETDLCFRIWLAGYKVIYLPDSVIYHVAGGDTTDTYHYDRRLYLTFKNMNCCYLKNFGWRNLLTIYPLFLCLQLGLMMYFLVKLQFVNALAMFRGYWWNIIHLDSTLKKRHYIQRKIRQVSDSLLSKQIVFNPGIFYYYCLLFDAKRYQDKRLNSDV